MLGGLAAYLLNFLAGKNKNSKLVQSWLAAHRQLLEENFSVIGRLYSLSIIIIIIVIITSVGKYLGIWQIPNPMELGTCSKIRNPTDT